MFHFTLCFAIFFSTENINAENISLYTVFFNAENVSLYAVFFSAENIDFFTREMISYKIKFADENGLFCQKQGKVLSEK